MEEQVLERPVVAAEHTTEVHRLRLQPTSGWGRLNLGELWAHRELVYFLMWRDIMVRYKQTVLGAGWAILQPAMTMLVFSLFFGKLAKMPSDGVPYSVFSYVALVPWTFFANGMNQASNGLVHNQNLITKVYFPRLALPIASVMAGLLDFFLAFLLMLAMVAWYHIVPSWTVVFLPLFLALALIAALGVGLWLAALNVQFRDVHYVVPFITQFWMFATPIAYPSSLLPEPWRTIYGLNPMAGVVEGFRWTLLGVGSPGPIVAMSACSAIVLLISGMFYFRRMERTFADVV
jgi:lipopolysaccharide transport system permease protein